MRSASLPSSLTLLWAAEQKVAGGWLGINPADLSQDPLAVWLNTPAQAVVLFISLPCLVREGRPASSLQSCPVSLPAHPISPLAVSQAAFCPRKGPLCQVSPR